MSGKTRVDCPICWGKYHTPGWVLCNKCNGFGYIQNVPLMGIKPSYRNSMDPHRPCPKCNRDDRGDNPGNVPCLKCEGEGTIWGYEDEYLTCRECGRSFTFSSGEQEFFEERGFTPPTRCPQCRKKKPR